MALVKRFAGAAVILAAIIALLFHPSRTPHDFVQTDPAPTFIPKQLRNSVAAQIVVYVAGAVRKPGLYHLSAGSRGIDAVHAAGGLSAQADPAGVNLAEQLEDGEQITAPVIGERTFKRPASRAHRGNHKRRKRRSNVLTPIAPIDLNSADAQMLAQLPGIGDELARRIIAFRGANGPFASLDELADVAGMTPRLIASLTPYLTISH